MLVRIKLDILKSSISFNYRALSHLNNHHHQCHHYHHQPHHYHHQPHHYHHQPHHYHHQRHHYHYNHNNERHFNNGDNNGDKRLLGLGSVISVLLLGTQDVRDYIRGLISPPPLLHLSLPPPPLLHLSLPPDAPPFRIYLRSDDLKSSSSPPSSSSSSSLPSSSSSSSSSSSPTSSSSSSSPEERETYEELQDEWNQQQTRYQREIERLERENRELNRLLQHKQHKQQPNVKSGLVDMYSHMLDTLAHYHHTFPPHDNHHGNYHHGDDGWRDELTRVVVVGDQSSGKTSVLESLIQARIFPRGGGEMMTRAPVQVTLSEGPHHIAILNNNNNNNDNNNDNDNNDNNSNNNNNNNNNNGDLVFNLSKEQECEMLRREIERRMKVQAGSSVSNETISLRVQGPGLERMVLVDLPGVISTVTADMSLDTRERIRSLCLHHMTNPNSIILCVQDGSLDAERSNVTDLVQNVDKEGDRTIFVLTKVDLAEKNNLSPERIKRTLEGKLFPMKALAYFAVVTGKENNSGESLENIRKYEEDFFKHSLLFKQGALRAGQTGTTNLSMEVSSLFWKLVGESVQKQVQLLRGLKYNLEAEWNNKYPRHREMARSELFEKAKGEILDEVVGLSNLPPKYWDDQVMGNLWRDVSEFVFEEVYLPAVEVEGEGAFNTKIDIKLKEWVDKILPLRSMQMGQKTLEEEFYKLLTFSPLPPPSTPPQQNPTPSKKPNSKNRHDDLFDDLKRAIFWEVKGRMTPSDDQSEHRLRVLQLSTFEDRSVQSKEQWDAAVNFMKRVLMLKKQEGESQTEELFGASSWKQWFGRGGRNQQQMERRAVRKQLEKLLSARKQGRMKLTGDEMVALKQNLQAGSNQVVPDHVIEETWAHLYRQTFIERAMLTANDCSKEFYYYQQGFKDNSIDCSDVILFWRIERMLSTTSKAVRQHILNHQNRRLEGVVKGVLEEYSRDSEALERLLTGGRVQLAHQIKVVRSLLEQLEEFIHELNKSS